MSPDSRRARPAGWTQPLCAALLLPALVAGAAGPKAGEKRICVPSADGKAWDCGTPDNPPIERGLPAPVEVGASAEPPLFLAAPPSDPARAYAAPEAAPAPQPPLPDEFPTVQRGGELAPAPDSAPETAQAPPAEAPVPVAANPGPAPAAAEAAEVAGSAPNDPPAETTPPPLFLAAPAERRPFPLAPAETAREQAIAVAESDAPAAPDDSAQPQAPITAETTAGESTASTAPGTPVDVPVAPAEVAEPVALAPAPAPESVPAPVAIAEPAAAPAPDDDPVAAAPALALESPTPAPEVQAPVAPAVIASPPVPIEEGPEVSFTLHQATAFLRLPASAWTVQLARGGREILASAPLRDGRQIESPLYAVAVGNAGVHQWLLLWSNFPDADAARAALRGLRLTGVPRRVGPLQAEVRSAGTQLFPGGAAGGTPNPVGVPGTADRYSATAPVGYAARREPSSAALPAAAFEVLPASAWTVQLARAGSSAGFDALLSRSGLSPADCHVVAIDDDGARTYLLLWSQFADADAARAAARSLRGAPGAFVRRIGPLQAEARGAR
jgi:hypothetical protein